MLIRGIPEGRTNKSPEAKLMLRNGQIALGKVNKIYPNNRAEVQIGGHRLIAQIETPLSVGERYIFQIEQKENQMIHLKVISSQISEINNNHIQTLLRQLSIGINDVNMTFVQSLINKRIPFNQQELVQLLQLLDNVGHSSTIQRILKQMLINKIPLEENYLRAFLAFQTNNLSSAMIKAVEEINSHPQSMEIEKAKSLLTSLLHPVTSEQISSLPQHELRALIQTLRVFNYIRLEDSGVTADRYSALSQGEKIRTGTVEAILHELMRTAKQDTEKNSMNHFIKQY